MCTKKILYSAGAAKHVQLTDRPKGGKLTFLQICYTTDCVRTFASQMNMPMVMAIDKLRNIKGALSLISRSAKQEPAMPVKDVIQQVLHMS